MLKLNVRNLFCIDFFCGVYVPAGNYQVNQTNTVSKSTKFYYQRNCSSPREVTKTFTLHFVKKRFHTSSNWYVCTILYKNSSNIKSIKVYCQAILGISQFPLEKSAADQFHKDSVSTWTQKHYLGHCIVILEKQTFNMYQTLSENHTFL